MNKNFGYKLEEDDDEDTTIGAGDVKAQDNHVYFYSQIDQCTILNLNYVLRKVATEIVGAFKLVATPPPLILHINSLGGQIYSGFAAVDTILTLPVEVHTIVEGFAASAAAGIAMAGKKRYIFPQGYMMIHQLSAGVIGTHERFKDEISNQESTMETVKAFYLKYSKIQASQLDDLLKRDLLFNAERCVELGLVDEIYTGK